MNTRIWAAALAAVVGAVACSDITFEGGGPITLTLTADRTTAAKGQVLAEHRVAALVRLLRAIKQDQVTAALMEEFQSGAKSPRSPWEHTGRTS